MTQPASSLKYLVCIDGSQQAHEAFQAALTSAKALKAQLYIVAVVEHVSSVALGMGGAHAIANSIEAERELEHRYRHLLASYALRCQDEGVAYTALLGTSSDIGPFIVKLADSYRIDIIFTGRSGAGKASRFFLGSVSNHVVDHAHCNVMVVRSSMEDEIHAPIAMIDRLEEAERRRRERAARIDDPHQHPHRQQEDLKRVIEAEEQERRRREAEDMVVREHTGRADVIDAEEKERKARLHELAAQHLIVSHQADEFRRLLNQNIVNMRSTKLRSAQTTTVASNQHLPEESPQQVQDAAEDWMRSFHSITGTDRADESRQHRHEAIAQEVQLVHEKPASR